MTVNPLSVKPPAQAGKLSSPRYPWHETRAAPGKMPNASTACTGSVSTSGVTSPIDKETLRRQIVGLAVKNDFKPDDKRSPREIFFRDSTDHNITYRDIPKCVKSSSVTFDTALHLSSQIERPLRRTPRKVKADPLELKAHEESTMIRANKQEVLQNSIRRTKTTMDKSVDTKPPLAKPKLVRFRMDEHTIGDTKIPLVNIRAVSPGPTNGFKHTVKTDVSSSYEVRGNAIALKKEGLKGLVEYRDLCTESEKRQNSLQASLKIFRRRIKLKQDKFIQPNESTADDYVIHTARPTFGDTVSPLTPLPPGPAVDERGEPLAGRPLSSDEHVRILKSALHNRHHGGNEIIKAKETDLFDNSEMYKNIKCSYRLPENPNWSKEVSFKDMKDDSIPNVKTYVLQEDRMNPHTKFKKNNIQNAVTLNIHNLSVHNSITRVNGHKMRVGEGEVNFDPRFVDWLEDSLSNSRSLSKSASLLTDDTLEPCITPSVKRRVATKT
ncbi:uncharacterized protein LOC128210177 isoform X1 [Mya arenaria]|uniref:uncharacterized protein LOC128210177 isoform X1 n=2 Tax=Mya arenaria TaxID=6604 RepID=UPI0022E7847F|nr:uncharacterized protein LOC128210177 isoform X1 [Mya arenaria]